MTPCMVPPHAAQRANPLSRNFRRSATAALGAATGAGVTLGLQPLEGADVNVDRPVTFVPLASVGLLPGVEGVVEHLLHTVGREGARLVLDLPTAALDPRTHRARQRAGSPKLQLILCIEVLVRQPPDEVVVRLILACSVIQRSTLPRSSTSRCTSQAPAGCLRDFGRAAGGYTLP